MQLTIVHGVRGYIDENGTAQLNLEDTAKGLGILKLDKKDGQEYSRVNKQAIKGWLIDFGILNSENEFPEFVSENIFYRLAMKAKNEMAEAFQVKVADEILPTIRKTGGYIANDDLFLEIYLPFADTQTRLMFRTTLTTVRKQNELIIEQKKEINHKEHIIFGLVDEIDLATKRQVLNRVVRKAGADKVQKRWNELYKQFEMKYHVNLQWNLESYNETFKPKLKSKLDYIDKVMNRVPELYEIACKIYENDVRVLTAEIYELTGNTVAVLS